MTYDFLSHHTMENMDAKSRLRRLHDLTLASSFKLTPWFKSGEKPAHRGVYLVKATPSHSIGFRYFNGRRWKPWAPNIQWAFNLRESHMDAYQRDEWKGIAA